MSQWFGHNRQQNGSRVLTLQSHVFSGKNPVLFAFTLDSLEVSDLFKAGYFYNLNIVSPLSNFKVHYYKTQFTMKN